MSGDHDLAEHERRCEESRRQIVEHLARIDAHLVRNERQHWLLFGGVGMMAVFQVAAWLI